MRFNLIAFNTTKELLTNFKNISFGLKVSLKHNDFKHKRYF